MIISLALALAATQPESSHDHRIDTPSSAEQKRGRRVMHEFGRCAAGQEPEIAAEFVRVGLDGTIDSDAFDRLTDRECLGLRAGRLSMQPFFFRGALAQYLVGAGATPDASTLAEIPTLGDYGSPNENGEYGPNMGAYVYSVRLGECIVRRDTQAALALLNTEYDSAAERPAFQALGNALAGCVPKGETVALDRTTVRAGIAIAAFRLADAQREGSAN